MRDGKVYYIEQYPHNLGLYFFYKTTISHQAALIRKDTFDKELYDVSRRICADSKHFLKLAFEGENFEYLGITLVSVDTAGCSAQKSNAPKMAIEKKKNIEEIIPPSVISDYERMRMMEVQLQNELVVLALNIFKTNKYIRTIIRICMNTMLILHSAFEKTKSIKES